MSVTRRTGAVLTLVTVGALLVAGCGGGGGGNNGPSWDAAAISASQQGAGVTPVLVNSNVGVGDTRLAFGLFRPDQSLLADATVTVHLFRLAEDPEHAPTQADPAGDLTLHPVSLQQGADHVHADGTVHHHVGATATVYVARTRIDVAGWWGASLDVHGGDVSTDGMQIRFYVQDHTSEPAVGDPAPKTRQQTIADTTLDNLDSTLPPNEGLHDLTIEDALADPRPVVVAFATPAFCQTQFCGPVMEDVVIPAWHQYGDRVDFIHVEPWDLTKARQGTLEPVEAVRDWGLLSEPFVFVIDGSGIITAKFEGIIGADELNQAIEAVLGGSEGAAAPAATATASGN